MKNRLYMHISLLYYVRTILTNINTLKILHNPVGIEWKMGRDAALKDLEYIPPLTS